MGVGKILTTDWPDSSCVPCQNSSLGDYGRKLCDGDFAGRIWWRVGMSGEERDCHQSVSSLC